jgi:hypothetical protein
LSAPYALRYTFCESEDVVEKESQVWAAIICDLGVKSAEQVDAIANFGIVAIKVQGEQVLK